VSIGRGGEAIELLLAKPMNIGYFKPSPWLRETDAKGEPA